MPLSNSLAPFFSPRGIAVIGASHNPTKLGYGLARNLVQSNYRGALHFINPRGGSLFGRPIIPSVSAAPDPVDLAILLIPAVGIPPVLEECGRRGLRAAIIASGGFRETGPQGAQLEKDCLLVAQKYGMRLMGPNCVGLLDTHLPLDATFLPPPGPPPGDVAFISQSGAICAAVNDWARGQGFGLSRLVSLGNQVDVTETDVLAPVAADPYTHVLTLYLEGVSDGRRFVEEATRVAQSKPVIALKVGRFASGQRAVTSHTGALAGRESAFNAAFRRAGVIRAETSEEMFDWARALAWCPLPKGRSMTILTNAGGPGVTAADALESNGLTLANLQESTQGALSSILPSAASLHNPVDMLASASPEQYASCLEILLADDGINGVLVILPPPPMYTAGAVAMALIPVIHSASKPVVIALMGERLIQEAVEHFRAAHVPEYRFPERAASALAILARRAEFLAQVGSSPALTRSKKRKGLKATQAILDEYHSSAGTGTRETAKDNNFLPTEIASRILHAYGIAVPESGLARSPDEAVILARQIGFPVALKIASPLVLHKSDIGGVLLNLSNESSVSQGFADLIKATPLSQPGQEIQGMLVQKMIPPGQEVIIGAIQDAQFGALVMFGSGGIEVEGLKDVEFALAPLTPAEAESLLDSTWAGRRLNGYRNMPSADRKAVLNSLLRFSHLAADFPQFEEIEINPLRVLPEGNGAYALDIRICLNA